ncbi:cytochrome d ubiquinol oxidase subunit I [Natronocella acetinitrilica]|uniref:Cytochrome d ubiquinol oxidase subunit I n=1 Tax=Natronocella acetinitrilica TaxID=414046 RepID=A0AAE3G496_9GAMM|nr:cytochrome ubiquinol oxidase subunit I [Natronocella acetinitrilica]MCP1675535.1 cytochrome d ubiquinol oxidase subunit I [Natronocella acetinitrilica]
MDLDPLLLSRIQFAFVVSFHIIFPAFTIGLASYIAVLEGLWFKTGNPVYLRLSKMWIKVFAVSFGMGVVSGIVMSFQFGTNWSELSYASANFLGPILSYEVVTAFFLEATFLGVLLFGRSKLPQGGHLLAAIMMAVGTLISSFWILSANSWMQTPAGIEMRDGIVHVVSWMEAIFNPSFGYRFAHMVLAAYLTTAFFVIGVSAWYLLKQRSEQYAKKMFSMTLWLVAILAPMQIFIGDMHGLDTFEHQPAKVAAMEGNWETSRGVPLLLFAIPDSAAETNHFEIGIPRLASLILTHDLDGEVPGLKEWAPEDRPPVGPVFWAFRVMVGIGMAMLGVAMIGLWLRWKGRLYDTPWFKKVCVAMMPAPFIAVLAGWLTTEIGRQPWVLYEIMRTEDALSPSLTGGMALTSLIVFFIVYAVIFVAGGYYISKILGGGPEKEEAETESQGRAARPLSAVDSPFDAVER